MTIQRMEPVGIVVDDLAAATGFFVELGLEPQFSTEGGRADGRTPADAGATNSGCGRISVTSVASNAMLAPNVRGPSLFVTSAR
jgi:hypothetical protein